MQKTKKVIMIPLNSFALEIIANCNKHAIKTQSSSVFQYVDNQVINRNLKEIAKAYGIDKLITMHTSRHSYGSNLVEANINLTTIMALMGHSKITDTAIYARSLTSNLHQSVEKLGELYHAV